LLTNRARKGLRALQLLLSLALLAWLLHHYHYSLSTLRIPPAGLPWLLPCVVIALVMIPALAGLRWQAMLRSLGARYPLPALIRINFLSIFWGVLLPSADGFVLIRACLLMRKLERKTVLGSVILEKYLGVLCLFSLALVFSFFVTRAPALHTLRLVLTAAIALLLGVVALVRRIPAGTRGKGTIIGRAHDFLRSLAAIVAGARKTMLARGLALILSVQFLSILNIHFLFLLLGRPLPLANHLCLVPVIQTISLLPLTFNGFGIREGAFVFFYRLLGVPPEVLISVSLLHFLLLTGAPALVGGVLSLSAGVSPAGITRESRDQGEALP